jgi:hypothetical protein
MLLIIHPSLSFSTPSSGIRLPDVRPHFHALAGCVCQLEASQEETPRRSTAFSCVSWRWSTFQRFQNIGHLRPINMSGRTFVPFCSILAYTLCAKLVQIYTPSSAVRQCAYSLHSGTLPQLAASTSSHFAESRQLSSFMSRYSYILGAMPRRQGVGWFHPIVNPSGNRAVRS